jgi:hypothetical protein
MLKSIQVCTLPGQEHLLGLFRSCSVNSRQITLPLQSFVNVYYLYMQSKISVKLPQIKSERSCNNIDKLSIEKLYNSNPLGNKRLHNKEWIKTLNRLRLISLTPEVGHEAKEISKIYTSPSINSKTSLENKKFKNLKHNRQKKTVLSIITSPKPIESTLPVLSIPSNYFKMSFKQFSCPFPDNHQMRFFRNKYRLHFSGKSDWKSMVEYHKF